MEAAADPGVSAGLTIFSDSKDPTFGNGPYPSASDVALGYVDAAHQMALGARLGGRPQDGTPTHAALMGGYAQLEKYTASAPVQSGGKKVLVLITDGVPSDDCMSIPLLSNYATNACVQEAASELKAAAPNGPIQTFVVGVGDFSSGSFFGVRVPNGIDPGFLGNLAQAGGTGASGCNPNETTSTSDLCYFEIDPSTSPSASDLQMKFETALDAIRGQVISCTFPLQGNDLGNVDPTRVNVTVNGKTILQDAANGWTYDTPAAPTEIILHGAACNAASTDLHANVQIVLGCTTQVK
jgi:hypothetical protein